MSRACRRDIVTRVRATGPEKVSSAGKRHSCRCRLPPGSRPRGRLPAPGPFRPAAPDKRPPAPTREPNVQPPSVPGPRWQMPSPFGRASETSRIHWFPWACADSRAAGSVHPTAWLAAAGLAGCSWPTPTGSPACRPPHTHSPTVTGGRACVSFCATPADRERGREGWGTCVGVSVLRALGTSACARSR